ncbi:hypothetical protein EI94DRAFT_1705019 [Lactarius quietus]|nr:hypothetical protein EI94DRAFT_1705019 [Lactarius quietus]
MVQEEPFKETEVAMVKTTLRGYQEVIYGLSAMVQSDSVMTGQMSGRQTNGRLSVWADKADRVLVSHRLPGRSLHSAYDQVQCSKHPLRKSRPWANGNDAMMKRHIDEHRHDWTEIGDAMSCPAVEC